LLQRFPGNRDAEQLLAQIELAFGSPQRAAELYAGLVRRRPDFAELSNLGVAQLLLGRYAESAASLEQASAMAPKSASAALNLADALALQGRRARPRRSIVAFSSSSRTTRRRASGRRCRSRRRPRPTWGRRR